ncbi:hypothetical protein [Polyangium aurulentum]|uniref:hypothetical protein n=1 Tax=Polyangium aurulentum TaxID=2567896 RepID=UPI0010AE02DB|nr:hypothetical protein [Polyangium aurulentum]UQA60987.1 hypothetical protein E8A73_011125 [Polyangium aurulentum]
MACEEERTRLIGEIASLLREASVPDEARAAGLTLIGWLARRMPGEPVSMAGVDEMLRRCAEKKAHAAQVNGVASHGAKVNGAANGVASHGAKANGTANGVASHGTKANGAKRGSGGRRAR